MSEARDLSKGETEEQRVNGSKVTSRTLYSDFTVAGESLSTLRDSCMYVR